MNDICHICGNQEFEDRAVSRVYDDDDGNPMFIERIPAHVCLQCGEATFSLETVRHIEAMLARRSKSEPTKFAPVYEYA